MIKGLIFVILSGYPLIYSCFNATVIACSKYLLSFLSIAFINRFLSSQESLYMIHDDFNLFYDIYNIVAEHN